MATLSNYISLSTNIPTVTNAAPNATSTAYKSLNRLHNTRKGESNAGETQQASIGGNLSNPAGNLLGRTVM